jgi:hypothetical protein
MEGTVPALPQSRASRDGTLSVSICTNCSYPQPSGKRQQERGQVRELAKLGLKKHKHVIKGIPPQRMETVLFVSFVEKEDDIKMGKTGQS